ncbi:acyl-CoA dehydrogenase family protein [Kitasatospora cineracea]|uniref:acyl-CoA dehydrogenase family protein n=1 Tax=Kitasatospora cineracea TaxID=88074 RepID=UPI00341E05BF
MSTTAPASAAAVAGELDALLAERLTPALLAALDRDEEFPAGPLALLDAFGLPAHYVPAEHGGRLTDHEVLLGLWRTLARRDLTLAVAHGKTYLGTAPVWIAGSERQCRELAGRVLGGARVAWALSEPGHGADLLANEATAVRTGSDGERDGSGDGESDGGGWRLDGTKWPINNATRGSHLTVLARTGEPGHPRAHSLLLVDKAALDPAAHRPLPKARTHGIRGVDISGIEFTGAVLPADALLGAEGTGTETVLRALQLTRTMCAALSLGAGEHALRLTAGFAAERIIQQKPLADRAHVRAVLARCGALLAATEAAAITGARSAHALTGELSVVSAVVKGLAPTLVDGVIGELAELLGSRSFLTGVHADGAFQKVWRDHQIVAVFDGSTPVNRNALAHQFPRLVRSFAAGTADAAGLAEAAAAGTPPRPLDRTALALLSRTGCSTVQSLPALAAELAADGAPEPLLDQVRDLVGLADELHWRLAEVRPAAHPEHEAYELAAGYELLYAAAAALRLWHANRAGHRDEPLWQDALWIRAALRELLGRLAARLDREAPAAAADDDLLTDRMAAAVLRGVREHTPVTPFGTPLATEDQS